MDDVVKKDWIERAVETFKFHRTKLQSQDKWTATLTAKELRRSVGSVCEDLKIARWMRTHPKDIEKFEYAYEALEWIKEREKKMEIGE